MARATGATDRSKRRTQDKAQSEIKDLNIDFKQSPTVWRFLNDNSFVRGLMGPVGSGKSYACATEIMLRALKQPVSPIDNTRHSRFAIVRNSYPELRTTTIKTWLEIFDEATWGPMRWSPPLTHHIQLPPKGELAGLDVEIIFLALDTPKDVRKLLSLELTGAWVNEARELPKAVVDGLTHRVGRYPTKAHGGCPHRFIIMDTNPMDDDHWYHRMAEKEKQNGKYQWKFFRQPGGVKEVDAQFEDAIYAAGKYWAVNDKAENISNLTEGYYEQMLIGKNLDWISCYAQGKYTFVQEGRPVWQEYADTLMSEDIEFLPEYPLQIGLDFGLTPAAVFGQRLDNGRWHVLHELVTFDMGLERFTTQLKVEINKMFPKAKEIRVWGDPAGSKRDEIFEVTAFDHLKTQGLNARPTPSNDFKVRREAGAMPMNRLINGKAGLIVNKTCSQLRKALAGGYYFKREAIGSGQERFKDVPFKNNFSHVGDAFGYLMLGGGEHRILTRSNARFGNQQQATAKVDFNVF